MSDLVCVIAGGEWQVPIIRKLQENNCKVLCINLYGYTAGAKLANYFEQIDVVDKEACLLAAAKYDLKGILTDQSDISVPTVAYIAEKLGLVGIGEECADLFTNKLRMRQKAKSLGVHCPEFEIAYDIEKVREFAKKTGLPVIVKPIDSQSSRGVIVVDDWEKLDSAIIEAFSFSKPTHPILVEKYIDGQEWTVEGFQQKNKHTALAISFKKHMPSLPTVASSINYVPITTSELHTTLISQNNSLVSGMGLNFGITHAEYKYFEGKFYLIEIAARGGGANISSQIIPLMSGVDANQLLIDHILGNETNEIKIKSTGVFAKLAFLNFDQGKVCTRTNEDNILSLEFVVDFKYNFKVGDILGPVVDDSSRHASVLLTANSHIELDRNLEVIENLVKVTYE